MEELLAPSFSPSPPSYGKKEIANHTLKTTFGVKQVTDGLGREQGMMGTGRDDLSKNIHFTQSCTCF